MTVSSMGSKYSGFDLIQMAVYDDLSDALNRRVIDIEISNRGDVVELVVE